MFIKEDIKEMSNEVEGLVKRVLEAMKELEHHRNELLKSSNPLVHLLDVADKEYEDLDNILYNLDRISDLLDEVK